MADRTVPAELFSRVSSVRLPVAIVEQIRALVRTRRLRPGDRLPSERELSEQLGASRVSVRQALRVLQADGVIESRIGARGGSYVSAPTPLRLGAGVAGLLEDASGSPAELTEARLAFELALVPLVVERATPSDVADLLAIADAQLAGAGYLPSRSAQFHQRVAACVRNAAIDMLAHAFHGPLLQSLRVAAQAGPAPGDRGAYEHRRFVEAVAARDTDAARAVMRAHIARTAERLAAAE